MKNLTCILCPKGCRMSADEAGNVTGAGCEKGVPYAREEMRRPTRTVTTTVRVENGTIRMLPVKSAAPVPKEKMLSVVEALAKVRVRAPVALGQVILSDAGGADIVAARSVPEQETGQ